MYIIKFTHKYVDYLDVNFNKMLKMFVFQQSYAQYLYSSHRINKLSKAGAASVNTISSVNN